MRFINGVPKTDIALATQKRVSEGFLFLKIAINTKISDSSLNFTAYKIV
jgi:hypothetical protein